MAYAMTFLGFMIIGGSCTSKKGNPLLEVDGVELGSIQTCSQPVSDLYYTDRSEEFGLSDWFSDSEYHENGGSLTVLDVDKDSDMDIIHCFENGKLSLFRFTNGLFNRETLGGDCSPVAVIDLDKDGWYDIVSIGYTMEIFWNQQGVFSTEVGETLLQFIQDISPGDFNNDGIVDLFVTNGDFTEPSTIYWGDSENQYTITEIPETTNQPGFDSMLADFDQNGWLDVYLINDRGPEFGPNMMLYNLDGQLTPQAENGTDVVMSGMGGDMGDFNEDGYVDFYVTGAERNYLLQGGADQQWTDMTMAMGVNDMTGRHMAWAALFLDYDNDGFADIFRIDGDTFYQGMLSPVILPMGMKLFNQGMNFQEVSQQVGLTRQGSFRNVVAEELNGDGVLDLVIGDIVDQISVYTSNGCTENNWLSVEAPVGTSIRVSVAGRTIQRRITNESSFHGARRPMTWIGLGEQNSIDQFDFKRPNEDWINYPGPIEARRNIKINF